MFSSYVKYWQQIGDSIAMDADATSELHRRGVAATDDSSKFIWHQVGKFISSWILLADFFVFRKLYLLHLV